MKKVMQGFEHLKSATTIDDVENILDEISIDKKYRLSKETYPQLKFKINSTHEIDELKNIFTSDNLLADTSRLNTLGKLLYAIAWKNGDLPKIKHIIEGIISEEDKERNKGIVFFQFGKHLSGRKNEPIIDQHVLRAFGIYDAKDDNLKIEYYKKLSVVGKNENVLIKKYKEWLQAGLTEKLRNCENYTYHVDSVLFALGKYAKSKSLS